MTPEFARPHRIDTIGAGESRVAIAAEEAERAALAKRFGLISIDHLRAELAVRRDSAGIVATGHLSGAVVQPCSVTGDPVPAKVEENFTIRFLPEGAVAAAADEVELDDADCDTVFYTGSAIDLGEAAAQTLALALDPFPRSPNAEGALREAGVLKEDETGPFAALAALKNKL